jgi:hypothetical protein
MSKPVRKVSADLLIRANNAAASTDDLVAVTYRLQALAKLAQGGDISGLTMNLHGREYKLINEAALKAAATCPLVLRGKFGEAEFDREKFLQLALSFTEPEGNG